MRKILCTYLPTGYKSWFALYQEAQKHIRPGLDYVEWVLMPKAAFTPLTMAAHVEVSSIAFSIRYLEQQTLAELIELREIETFNKKELEILHYSLNTLSTYSGGDKEVLSVHKKVRELLTDERKKLRRG